MCASLVSRMHVSNHVPVPTFRVLYLSVHAMSKSEGHLPWRSSLMYDLKCFAIRDGSA